MTAAAALAVWLASAWGYRDELETQRTLLLTTLILTGLGNVLIVGEGDRRLVGWVALAAPLATAAVLLGGLMIWEPARTQAMP